MLLSFKLTRNLIVQFYNESVFSLRGHGNLYKDKSNESCCMLKTFMIVFYHFLPNDSSNYSPVIKMSGRFLTGDINFSTAHYIISLIYKLTYILSTILENFQPTTKFTEKLLGKARFTPKSHKDAIASLGGS